MKNIAVLLAGCGVFDGSEIHEAVFTLLAISQRGGRYHCFAPDKDQLHVLNHLTGGEMNEKRNVLTESARIARGVVQDLALLKASDFDALVIPGGFGAAKNLNQWAVKGPDGDIDPEVKRVILEFARAQKPIAGLCMGPTVIAKALEGSGIRPKLTVGTTTEESPYDIAGISGGMEKIGAITEMKSVRSIAVDETNRIVTAPCYMMEASIAEVHDNIQEVVSALFQM
jgi:enhancing lycopene biosynthesis protein 2